MTSHLILLLKNNILIFNNEPFRSFSLVGWPYPHLARLGLQEAPRLTPHWPRCLSLLGPGALQHVGVRLHPGVGRLWPPALPSHFHPPGAIYRGHHNADAHDAPAPELPRQSQETLLLLNLLNYFSGALCTVRTSFSFFLLQICRENQRWVYTLLIS